MPSEEVAHPRAIARMNYVNFAAITNKFGILMVNWPLPRICCPSEIGPIADVVKLYNAWESGLTHFIHLTPAQLREHQRQEFEAQQAATHAVSLPEFVEGSSTSPAVASASAPPAHMSLTASAPPVPTPPFAASASEHVLTASGTTLDTKKPKARKTRSDKGKPRKPRADKAKNLPADQNAE